MSQHPLTNFLVAAADAADFTDVVQGSVEIHLVTGHTLTGQVDYVSEDGQFFRLIRIWKVRNEARQHVGWDSADSPIDVVTAHVTHANFHEAGA